MPTFDALEGYVRHTSAAMFDLAAQICGGRAEEASERAGVAYGITALLRSFALNASRRQLFVPIEALDDMTAPGHIFAGHSSPGLVAALGTLRKRARESLAAFEAQLPQLPVAAMPAFLPVALVPGYLVGDGAARLRPVQDGCGGSAVAAAVDAVAGGASLFAGDAALSATGCRRASPWRSRARPSRPPLRRGVAGARFLPRSANAR